MKIIISSGGRFHAVHLAHQLEKQGHLSTLFTAAYDAQDVQYLQPSKVSVYRLGKWLDILFEKARLSKLIPLTTWYQFKDNLFD